MTIHRTKTWQVQAFWLQIMIRIWSRYNSNLRATTGIFILIYYKENVISINFFICVSTFSIRSIIFSKNNNLQNFVIFKSFFPIYSNYFTYTYSSHFGCRRTINCIVPVFVPSHSFSSVSKEFVISPLHSTSCNKNSSGHLMLP